MQLLTLVWAHQQLGLGLDQGAYLQGIAGLGVVAGAVLAARCVPTAKAYRVLPLGLLLGLSMMLMLLNHSLVTAGLLMIVVGALSGVFVVPMNAVLQARGVEILTAGRSIAVQNFYENLSILFSMAIYGVLMGANLSVSGLVVFDCIMVSGLMAWFIFSWFKRPMPS